MIQGYRRTFASIVEAYRAFCRERVYVCAYCDHCLDEIEIEDWLVDALSNARSQALRDAEEAVRNARAQFDINSYSGYQSEIGIFEDAWKVSQATIKNRILNAIRSLHPQDTTKR